MVLDGVIFLAATKRVAMIGHFLAVTKRATKIYCGYGWGNFLDATKMVTMDGGLFWLQLK